MRRATSSQVQRTQERSRPVEFGKLDEIFTRNERALAEVFEPREMNALRQAHKLLRPLKDLSTQGAATAPGRSSEELWRLLEGGLKARYGVLKGGGILRTIRIFVATLPDNKQAVDEIMTRMFFDPDLAVHLLAGRKVDAGGPAYNAKLLRLLALGEGARESTEAE